MRNLSIAGTWIALGMVLGVCLGACGGLPSATPPRPTVGVSVSAATPEPTPAIDLKTEIKATRPWKIAFAPKFKLYGETGHLSAYWQPAWEGAQQAGLAAGVNVELIVAKVSGQSDADYVEPQIRLIADLIETHAVDGLIIAPFDSNRLAPVVDKAIAAGIPTIAMDTPVNSDHLLTYVAFDNRAAGQVVGEWVVRRLGGPGRALILEGPPDQQNAVERRNGFSAGLQTGDIDVLNTQPADWESEPARKITAAWLKMYPQVDAILAANDTMALGAAQAVAEAKRTGILITGFDATAQGVAAVEAGQIAAPLDQAPGQQARLALQLLLRRLERGETFPPIIYLPDGLMVTPDNVDHYLP
jgi:ribose transport system substrate-binding protein